MNEIKKVVFKCLEYRRLELQESRDGCGVRGQAAIEQLENGAVRLDRARH